MDLLTSLASVTTWEAACRLQGAYSLVNILIDGNFQARAESRYTPDTPPAIPEYMATVGTNPEDY